MIQLHNLRPPRGAKKSRKRVGRGQGSGLGETAGRGMNGQNSRSGGGVRPGFEGGQMPLFRRIPKRGFNNKRFEKEYNIINVSRLNIFENNTEVTPQILLENNLISSTKYDIKILGDGELKVALNIKAHKFTKSATEKIQKAGGKAEVI